MGIQKSVTYEFRTLDHISTVLADILQQFPDLGDAEIAISELMINAVEHGIVGIDYNEKSKLLENGTIFKEIESRLQDQRYAERGAVIEVKAFDDEIVIFVADDGGGFAWKEYLDRNISKITGLHGRGIYVSEQFFKTLTYIGSGNKVVAVF